MKTVTKPLYLPCVCLLCHSPNEISDIHGVYLFQELDLVKKDQEVYKLIGPVLIKQDIEEALQNVTKRMDYIKGEL